MRSKLTFFIFNDVTIAINRVFVSDVTDIASQLGIKVYLLKKLLETTSSNSSLMFNNEREAQVPEPFQVLVTC